MSDAPVRHGPDGHSRRALDGTAVWLRLAGMLGVINVVAAAIVGGVVIFRAGIVHFAHVDQLSHKLDSGELMMRVGDEVVGDEGHGGHGDHFHDAVGLTDELLRGGGFWDIVGVALWGATAQGVMGLGLIVCCWRGGRRLSAAGSLE